MYEVPAGLVKYNTFAHRRRMGARRSAGFSLIEMVAVISIIAILVVLVAAAGRIAVTSTRRAQTQILLDSAAGIALEYAMNAEVDINHFSSSPFDPFDWSEPRIMTQADRATAGNTGVIDDISAPPAERVQQYSVERFLWAAWNHAATSSLIKSMESGTSSIIDIGDDGGPGNGFLEMRDAWGYRMIYVSMVSYDDAFLGDDFLPQWPQPYFASPGADGLWGNASVANSEAAEDNLYSFQKD